MPHVHPRHANVDLRHRAPFPAIATGTVSANETMVTSTAQTSTQSTGLNPKQIGVGLASVIAAILVVAVILYTFRAKKSTQKNKVPVNEKTGSAPDVVKVDLFRASPIVVEKPKAVYISEPNTSYDVHVGWVPQIKGITSQHSSENDVRYLETREPGQKNSSSVDSRPVPTRQRTLTPSSPPAPYKHASRPAELTIPEPDADNHLPSPLRTASLPQQIALAPQPVTNAFQSRLMTVYHTFAPTLGDELPVSIGETVKLLDEYDDGWCLVERTSLDRKQGIIPRFCLTERR